MVRDRRNVAIGIPFPACEVWTGDRDVPHSDRITNSRINIFGSRADCVLIGDRFTSRHTRIGGINNAHRYPRFRENTGIKFPNISTDNQRRNAKRDRHSRKKDAGFPSFCDPPASIYARVCADMRVCGRGV